MLQRGDRMEEEDKERVSKWQDAGIRVRKNEKVGRKEGRKQRVKRGE